MSNTNKTLIKPPFIWHHPDLDWRLVIKTVESNNIKKPYNTVSFEFQDLNFRVSLSDSFNIPANKAVSEQAKVMIALQYVAGLYTETLVHPAINAISAGRVQMPLQLTLWRSKNAAKVQQFLEAFTGEGDEWHAWGLPVVYGELGWSYEHLFPNGMPTSKTITDAARQVLNHGVERVAFTRESIDNMALITKHIVKYLSCTNQLTQSSAAKDTSKDDSADFIWLHPALGWRVAIKSEQVKVRNMPVEHISFEFSDAKTNASTKGRVNTHPGTLNDGEKVAAILQSLARVGGPFCVKPSKFGFEANNTTPELFAWRHGNEQRASEIIFALQGFGDQWETWSLPIIYGELEKQNIAPSGKLPDKVAVTKAAEQLFGVDSQHFNFTQEQTPVLCHMATQIAELLQPKEQPAPTAQSADKTVNQWANRPRKSESNLVLSKEDIDQSTSALSKDMGPIVIVASDLLKVTDQAKAAVDLEDERNALLEHIKVLKDGIELMARNGADVNAAIAAELLASSPTCTATQ